MAVNEEAAPVNAKPAKRFFVEMLTRDIELKDAVLDMLDNCLDGALRKNNNNPVNTSMPYEGYYAKISFNKDRFSIIDNCGGIDEDLAKNYAFRLGRPDTDRDKDLATVGVYGIGMKRAIFKIGQDAKVTSIHPRSSFEIAISPEWLKDDDNWNLPFENIEKPDTEYGTHIEIGELYSAISKTFEDDFYDDFCATIKEQYSYIIQKGFKVYVNETLVEAKRLGLLVDEEALRNSKAGITPYIYEVSNNGLNIFLSVGFYRPLPSDEEQIDEIEGRHSKDDAGWTIICNDRVIIANDKSSLTGWGSSGAPAYHSQFVAISGVVIIRSKDASLLPVTTTKRGIDVNSDIYWALRDKMVEGLKMFTNHTNKWKTPSEERETIQKSTTPVAPQNVASAVPSDKWRVVRTGLGGKQYIPELPVPRTTNPNKQIKFSRPADEIKTVAIYLFEDEEARPTDVGEQCFVEILKKAKKA